MSAICGILNLNGEPVDSTMLQQMVASSPYRGDDGIGYWQDGNIGFGHRAFHVTPESVREKQPLKSSDRKLVLVADVRLDNREELIQALPDAPDNPTDPDLLMAAYRRWGDACAEHLLGDFAFALWNAHKQELFLARDPMGAYGFYWRQIGNHFICASELTALLDFRGAEPKINESAVAKTLAGVSLDHDETFFEEFHLCSPAHCMTVSSSGMKKWRYWEIDPDYRIHYKTDEEYTDHFLELLTDAVSCRMRVIHPVGVSLSGGCDSTLIAAIASKQLHQLNLRQSRLKSFSYVFDKFPECDERKWIQPVVEQYDIDATYVNGDDKIAFNNIGQKPVFRDSFSYNCYDQLPASIIASAQRSGCRVFLDGHYGDTLFQGSSYYVADTLQEWRVRELWQWIRKYRHEIEWNEEVINRGLLPLIPRSVRQLYRMYRPLSRDTLNPGMATQRLLAVQAQMRKRKTPSGCHGLTPGRRRRCASLLNSIWSNGSVVGRGKYHNRFGVERISPYFDRRLVEFILAIPPEQLNRPGEHRFLQKSAMRRLLPELVVKRTGKTTYEVLIIAGLRENHQSAVSRLSRDPMVLRQDWVQTEWFREQLEREQPDHMGFPISMFLYLELWLRAVDISTHHGSWSEPFFMKS